MKVTEIFQSIQCEGPNTGKPTIFIRLAGCNMKCDFCDSKYSWKEGQEISVEDIIDKISDMRAIHIVITGGEPMLQYEEIKKLIEQLEVGAEIKTVKNFTFELETNGTIFDKETIEMFDYVSVSPKDEIDHRYTHYDECIFKFVCSDKKKFDDWLIFAEHHNIHQDKIYMMPQSTTRKEMLKESKWLVPLCIKNNVRYCPRVQLILWDNKRGV